MPRVLHATDPTTIQYDGAFAHFLGHMGLHNSERAAEGAEEATRPIGSIVTACFLLDRERWGDDAPFDERYVFSFEDHDFGLRSRALGHELLSVASARCLHGTGTPGLSFRRWQAYPERRVAYHIRNRWWTLLKNYQGRTLLLLAPAFALYESVQVLGCVRKRWLGHYGKSVRDTVGALPYLFSVRRAHQRRRLVPDRLLLAGGPLPFRPGVAAGRVDRAILSALDWTIARYWAWAKRMI
jgi:GT2 family glycosyltransferase